MYNNFREKYFKQEWIDMHVTEQLFIRIMSDSKTDSIFSLSRFLVNAFESRDLINTEKTLKPGTTYIISNFIYKC